MRAFLLSTIALGAFTSAALAEQPITLSDGQMDQVTAGQAYVGPGHPPSNITPPLAAPGTLFPGDPEGGGPATIEDSGRLGTIQTPGAPGSVFPGRPSAGKPPSDQ